ncbi:MAG: VTT domain-containing protein [Potamolinea sp.]
MAIESKQPFNRNLKLALGIGLLIILIFGITYFNFQKLLPSLLISVKSLGTWESIVFIALYILATLLFVPGSILTIGGGVLFGVVWGSIYVVIAATLGASLAFLIGRYLLRAWVAQQMNVMLSLKLLMKQLGNRDGKLFC